MSNLGSAPIVSAAALAPPEEPTAGDELDVMARRVDGALAGAVAGESHP